MIDTNKISQFQDDIKYRFRSDELLLKSLTHKSYLNEKPKNGPTMSEHNERLEFLGDAVLELIITDYLYTRFTHNEGFLTSLRAALVNYRTIGQVGQSIGLDDLILLSNSERAELGKARLTIVADAAEALIGAIYLDGGYSAAFDFVERYIIPLTDDIIEREAYRDYKTRLQEYSQKHFHQTPRYTITKTEGKDHDKTFYASVKVQDRILGEGIGRSKQEAETEAAREAMSQLDNK